MAFGVIRLGMCGQSASLVGSVCSNIVKDYELKNIHKLFVLESCIMQCLPILS